MTLLLNRMSAAILATSAGAATPLDPDDRRFLVAEDPDNPGELDALQKNAARSIADRAYDAFFKHGRFPALRRPGAGDARAQARLAAKTRANAEIPDSEVFTRQQERAQERRQAKRAASKFAI